MKNTETKPTVKPTLKTNGTYAKIREEFITSLGMVVNGYTGLTDSIRKAVKAGVERETLTEWAVEAGFKKEHVSSHISRVLAEVNKTKNPGGKKGRKASKEAKELAAKAIKMFGDEAPTILLAAYRVAKKLVE